MIPIAGLTAAFIFFLASAVHTYWALRPSPKGTSTALPSLANRAAFRPSRKLTLLVAFGLSVCGLLLLGKLAYLGTILPSKFYNYALQLLTLILIFRVIGDFRFIGIFKKIKDTPFARMDTLVYIPLCLILAACCFSVAVGKNP